MITWMIYLKKDLFLQTDLQNNHAMKRSYFLITAALFFVVFSSIAQARKDARPVPPPPPPVTIADAKPADYIIDFSKYDWNSPSKAAAKPVPQPPVKPVIKLVTKADAKPADYIIDFSKYDWNSPSKAAANSPAKPGEKPTPASAAGIKAVQIGSTKWTETNLDVSKFKNGDLIPEAKTKEEWVNVCNAKKPAWCYYNKNAENGKKYGKLYNWYAIKDKRGLAPEGWHIPTSEQWEELKYKAEGLIKKLKSNSGWKDDDNGTNQTGFSALPGGRRSSDGSFYNESESGYWWSAEVFITGSAGYGYEISTVVGKNVYDNDGLSVRCVKD